MVSDNDSSAESALPTLEEAQAQMDAAWDQRQDFVFSHETPLSAEDAAELERLNGLTLSSLATYYAVRNPKTPRQL